MSEGQSLPGELEDTDSYGLAQDEPEESETGENLTRRTPAAHWKLSSKIVEENLAAGLSNEDLCMLIRRFNKVRLANGTKPKHSDDRLAANILLEGCSWASTTRYRSQ